jgi:hypothetical protein
MTNKVGLTFSVGDTTLATPHYGLRLVLSKTIRIGDTKYHILVDFGIRIGDNVRGEPVFSVMVAGWFCE